MERNEVIELMKSSKNEQEWNANCDKVKAAYSGNYPQWWYSTIIMSGLLSRVSRNWV